jgi:hypothetical protein
VSVDHFEYRQRGQTFDSYGKATSHKYVGGCIFVDHASSYVHVEHQLGFFGSGNNQSKSILLKIVYGQWDLCSRLSHRQWSFQSQCVFETHSRDSSTSQVCGTNAHHQNGVSERDIQSISNMARSMILHAIIHWKDGIDASLMHHCGHT